MKLQQKKNNNAACKQLGGARGKLHIGTSGWSYKHWRGIFYPADVPVAGQLAFYSQQFDTTEINSSLSRRTSGSVPR